MHQPPALLPLDEALSILRAALPQRWEPALQADRDDPPAARSAMDGVALRTQDGPLPRRIVGTLFAGDPLPPQVLGSGEALKIMTGALIPAGADAVAPVEWTRVEGNRVHLDRLPEPGAFIRTQGEQARSGDRLLDEGPGHAARTGLAAFVGSPTRIPARVSVGVASTGDEVVPNPGPHQIRDSNAPMLVHLAHRLGAEAAVIPAVPDTAEALHRFLETSRAHQVVITSGGVSMGERDLLPQVLKEAGARILFHKLDLKPGKPTLVALLDTRVFLALPGNPVSAYLNARIFLPTILAGLEGHRPLALWHQGSLATFVPNPDARPLLHPCILDGTTLHPLESRGSADLVRLAQADAFAWIPPGGMPSGPARYLEVV